MNVLEIMKSSNSRIIIMDVKTVRCYERDLIMQKQKKKKKKKNSMKQICIIRPNACALTLISETIFRDGNG